MGSTGLNAATHWAFPELTLHGPLGRDPCGRICNVKESELGGVLAIISFCVLQNPVVVPEMILGRIPNDFRWRHTHIGCALTANCFSKCSFRPFDIEKGKESGASRL